MVDDSDDIRLLLRTLLAAGGFEVAEAPSGTDALRILAEAGRLPDVVLLDVQMPVMDGWDTLAAIRAEPATAAVPVVLCTVRSGAADRHRAWQLGCDGYLVKPFAVEAVVPEVQSVLTRGAGERAAYRQVRINGVEAELATEMKGLEWKSPR